MPSMGRTRWPVPCSTHGSAPLATRGPSALNDNVATSLRLSLATTLRAARACRRPLASTSLLAARCRARLSRTGHGISHDASNAMLSGLGATLLTGAFPCAVTFSGTRLPRRTRASARVSACGSTRRHLEDGATPLAASPMQNAAALHTGALQQSYGAAQGAGC